MKTTTLLLLTATLAATNPSQTQAQEQKTQLLEPYAPKPSGPIPEGWEVKILKGSNIETKTTLKNGRTIKVNSPAYEIVPKEGSIVITDPGFDPKLANSQKHTIGAILTKYSETAEELQISLEKVLQELDKNLGKPKTEENEKNKNQKNPG